MLMTCVAAVWAGNATAHFRGLATWQAQDAINSGHTILLEVFIGIAAAALLAQAIAVVVVALGVMKAQKAILSHVTDLKAKAMPVLEKSNALLQDLTPKVAEITSNVQHISSVVRDKINEFEPTISAANITIKEANATVRDANAKTHEQIVRVNGMISSVLNAASDLGAKIHHGIRVPVREVSGVVNAVKATMESLIDKTRGFGSGIKPNPAGRRRPSAPWEPPIPPASSAGPAAATASSSVGPAQTQASTPAQTSAELAAASATNAFQRSEKRDLRM